LVDDYTRKPTIGRRDLLRVVASVGAAATVAASSASPGATATELPPNRDRGKRKSQYQANAPEVRTFYRVNSYPTK
jgi:nitrous oxide reductase